MPLVLRKNIQVFHGKVDFSVLKTIVLPLAKLTITDLPEGTYFSASLFPLLGLWG